MLMQQTALHRQPVVIPLLFDVYQRPLPGTEAEVLYPRQHKHVVIAVHHWLFGFVILFKRQCTKILVEVALEQTVLHDAISLELSFSMEYRLFVAHTS